MRARNCRGIAFATTAGAALLASLPALLLAKHPLPGPHTFACKATETPGEVRLSWDDLGIGDGSLHEAVLTRDGALLAKLAPDAADYLDRDVPDGRRSYALEIRVREPPDQDAIAVKTCEIVVGGLVCHVFGGIGTAPQVLVTWSQAPAGTSDIVVRRDGVEIATLSGDATEYQEEPLQGTHEYEAIALLPEGGTESLGTCLATYEPPVIGGFQRGDCNGDGSHDVSDGVCILLFLFSGGEAQCLDASDSDDTGVIEITDAIFLLGHLFLGGPVLPPPYPGCGRDASEDSLSCEVHTPCFTPPPP